LISGDPMYDVGELGSDIELWSIGFPGVLNMLISTSLA
jgi:hypothetical protein